MSDPRVRREIALRAAQMMYTRQEREYFQAKRKAARQVVGDERNADLPSNAEVREQVQLLAELLEGESRQRELGAMRVEALRFMRLLSRWKPHLIGSVLTGHTRAGSDIDLHVFADSAELVVDVLESAGYACTAERKSIVKRGEARTFRHIRFQARFSFELTVYTASQVNFPFVSSITGKRIERADSTGLEALIAREHPEVDVTAALREAEDFEAVDPLDMMAELLRPLEQVKQDPKHHPEGDALYHSLQVFQLALSVRGYDEEFLLAALLHDVGKAIDPSDHVRAGVEALEGLVTERTLWLVEHHMEAHEVRAGTISGRARRRLAASPDFEDLLLLSELDQAGRQGGVLVPSVDEALETVRSLGASG